ncbi:MAG TPA: hypothetical protein VLS27_15220 [Gammaproteobacteria bacterium]|nr:hypothetical protein [Gammaproteobacteria bacterium]
MRDEDKTPGVYFVGEGDTSELVHEYADGDYLLQDLAELFAVGELQQDGALIVLRDELRPLKVRADAESFDHEEGFIEMCLDIWRFGREKDEASLRFISVD